MKTLLIQWRKIRNNTGEYDEDQADDSKSTGQQAQCNWVIKKILLYYEDDPTTSQDMDKIQTKTMTKMTDYI